MKPFNQEQKDWISQHFQAGMELDDIALSTGRNIQRIKRSLADTGDIYLSWYKTPQENTLLLHLRELNIKTVEDYQSYIKDL